MATLGRETHIGVEVKIKKGSTLYNKIYRKSNKEFCSKGNRES